MGVTDDAFERATRRGAARRAKQPLAKAARYDRASGNVVIELSNGVEFSFPASSAQGLAGASASDLAKIEIAGGGTGIQFPRLDADLYVPALRRLARLTQMDGRAPGQGAAPPLWRSKRPRAQRQTRRSPQKQRV